MARRSVRGLRLGVATAMIGIATVGAHAEQYVLNGRLEAGDSTVEASPASSWYDAYTVDLREGQTIGIEVSGMSIFPYFFILNSRNERAYFASNTGSGFKDTWQVPATDTYLLLVSELYQQETPYQLVITIDGQAARAKRSPLPVTGLALHPGLPAKR